MARLTLLAFPVGNKTISFVFLCFMNDSLWNSQGVGQHCISYIDRLIYHHSVYSNNILMCLSQGCEFWYQASHCLQHFVEMLVTVQAYFLQKMPELSWQLLFGTVTYKFFASIQCKKVPYVFHWSVNRSCKERPPPFLWPNANSTCEHKLIEQTNTTHLLVVVLKRIRNWYINSFLDWLWPPFSCANKIIGNKFLPSVAEL